MEWAPGSWRRYEARQQPFYPDPAALEAAERELAAYPPLVSFAETQEMRTALAEAQAGRAFVLQGGDCAESFAEFAPATIAANYRLIRAMARRLAEASSLPVVTVGRMAGQFAKPRSSDLEEQDGRALPAYRGDIVNGIAFDAATRRPDPERMFRAYSQAAATLSHLRGHAEADGTVFHTGHEALLLPFEQALVRRDDETGRAYGASAHFLWVGQRTAFEGSAHVELLRGLANPIGLKCGPELRPESLLRLLDRLDPGHEPGRITLISRMGQDRVGAALPPLLCAVRAAGRPVLWVCDPMHGNTVRTGAYKTRPLARIFEEIRAFFAILGTEGFVPGGVHIEMTGRHVTECTGGTVSPNEADLADRYRSQCDPRLNPDQAMALAALVAGMLRPRAARAA